MYRSTALAAAAAAVLFGQLASAADLPTKAPAAVPVPPPVYNWTGFYIGGQAGGGWGRSTVTDIDASASFPAGFVQSSQDPSGALGGAYGGYNYQWGQLVLGIDGDYSWAKLTGSAIDPAVFNPPRTSDVALKNDKINWIATVTGRLGYALNNYMFFVKGGGAWAGFEGNAVLTRTVGATTTNIGLSSSSGTRDGWIVGGGVEWGFLPNWTAKVEYDYIGFSTANFTSTNTNLLNGTTQFLARSATSHLNIGKVGVAYKF
jgi:outer membrane immunogenic protein